MQKIKELLAKYKANRKKIITWVVSITLMILGIFTLMAYLGIRVALWTNTITFESHPLLQVESTGVGYALLVNKPIIARKVMALSPAVIEKKVLVDKCDWSKECVESYIEMVCEEDKLCESWLKYTSAHEGGYKDQYSQVNLNDVHGDGKIGSFGQMQFGESTYMRNCEATPNWKMDWRAQIRCAKKLYTEGSYKSHWFNNTNAWLELINK